MIIPENNDINPEVEFNWNEAWIFTSIYYSIQDGDKLDLSYIVGSADSLNHSGFSRNEFINAMIKFQANGILKVVNDILYYTEIGKNIIEKSEVIKGGQFSRVDISHKILNSESIKYKNRR